MVGIVKREGKLDIRLIVFIASSIFHPISFVYHISPIFLAYLSPNSHDLTSIHADY